MLWLWILLGIIGGLLALGLVLFMFSAGQLNKEYDIHTEKEDKIDE